MFDRYLKREGIIGITNRTPKSDAALIGNQNFHRQSSVFRPDLRAQNLHGAAAESLTTTLSNDKKLPQINQIRLLSIKTISNNLSVVLKNHRSILPGKPAAHPLLKLRHRHLIPVSFVPNQCVIQSGEQRTIIQCCRSEGHRGGEWLKQPLRVESLGTRKPPLFPTESRRVRVRRCELIGGMVII